MGDRIEIRPEHDRIKDLVAETVGIFRDIDLTAETLGDRFLTGRSSKLRTWHAGSVAI